MLSPNLFDTSHGYFVVVGVVVVDLSMDTRILYHTLYSYLPIVNGALLSAGSKFTKNQL